jgi:hypothetical protein
MQREGPTYECDRYDDTHHHENLFSFGAMSLKNDRPEKSEVSKTLTSCVNFRPARPPYVRCDDQERCRCRNKWIDENHFSQSWQVSFSI